MGDAVCQTREWDGDDLATTRSEESRESDGSDESMWAATTEDTVAREFQSAMETESGRQMVSLRDIHERLALEATRSAFWEILAKESLVERETAQPTVRHQGPPADETGDPTAFEASGVPKYPDVRCETLHEMMRQMQTLGSNLDALKERASNDQHTISALREEVKRTDRLKNGYKRQIKDLKASLDAYTTPTTTQARAHDRHDALNLQRKLAEMRVMMEGLRRERDAAQARVEVALGEQNELKERFARRECAIHSAQRRCRELEEALSRDGNKGPCRDPSDETTAASQTRCILVDVGTCTSVTSVTLWNESHATAVQDDPVHLENVSGVVEGNGAPDEGGDENESGSEELEEVESTEDKTEAATMATTEGATVEASVDEELAQADECARVSSTAFISPACPSYRRIFGDTHDLDNAARVLISADDVLAQCAAKILQLTNELHANRDELHGIKCQCAEQYDRAFKYKTVSSSLAMKVGRLEAHIATAKQSADEYRHQMEHLVQRQREAAAEESHRLEMEVQTLSQEQARLLLKLHAVQGDLAKSRALNLELGHPPEEAR